MFVPRHNCTTAVPVFDCDTLYSILLILDDAIFYIIKPDNNVCVYIVLCTYIGN